MAKKWPNPTELRQLAEGELTSQLDTLRKDLWQHRVKAKQGTLQQTHLLSAMRAQIARIRTVLVAQRKTETK